MRLTLKRAAIHPSDVTSGPPPDWPVSLCSCFALRNRPRQRSWVAACSPSLSPNALDVLGKGQERVKIKSQAYTVETRPIMQTLRNYCNLESWKSIVFCTVPFVLSNGC
ncbi:hypothetical protein NPIL_588241 [Nephila pilipes]|uniref:Uncharacterized protein n=1 Tax=Nephila pilipes TaxID=299642 RepID=A0A8X6UAQ8_NEPPI|nr:hypothetical protein NPIL_588241 [Nephila pilipes]